MKTYTLAQLETVTGAKKRSLQLWADRNVIQAEESTEGAGSGVHRQFSHDEAVIACAISAFAKRQSPIGRLFRIAYQFREVILPNERFRKQVDNALAGNCPVFLVVRSYGKEKRRGNSIIYFKIDSSDAWLDVSLISYGSHVAESFEEQAMANFATEMLSDTGSFTEILRLDVYLAGLR